jgi:hypothetical protein
MNSSPFIEDIRENFRHRTASFVGSGLRTQTRFISLSCLSMHRFLAGLYGLAFSSSYPGDVRVLGGLPGCGGAFQGSLNGGVSLRGLKAGGESAAGPDTSIRKTTVDCVNVGTQRPAQISHASDSSKIDKRSIAQQAPRKRQVFESAPLAITMSGIPQSTRQLVKPRKPESCAIRRP